MIRKPLWLAAGILLWTGVAWGGRVGLLTDGDGWPDLVRIGGSLLLGLVTAISLAVPWLRPRSAPQFYLFAIWTTGLWLRSMVVTWTGSGSLPFKLVHTVLAAGFFGFAYLVLMAARSALTEAASSNPPKGSEISRRSG
ncbi:MAG: hypothetical protein ACFCU2_04290 [Acidimicrobiia bacterium]